MLALLDAIRAELGPQAVLLSVRRVPLDPLAGMDAGSVLEGAAAVDPDAVAQQESAPTGTYDRPVMPSAPRAAETRLGSKSVTSQERDRAGAAVWLLVGAPGSGKTVASAKVAAWLRSQQSQPVGLLSTDACNSRQEPALRMHARKLGMPWTAAQSASELHEKVLSWNGRGPLVVDTPGVDGTQVASLRSVKAALEQTGARIETHLVLNAAAPAAEHTRLWKAFAPVGCGQTLLTHLDRTEDGADLVARLLSSKIGISFLGMGPKIPDDLILATPERLLQVFA